MKKQQKIKRQLNVVTNNEISGQNLTSPVPSFCTQEPHRHTFYEFVVILQDRCLHSVDGREPVELSRGDFFFITPDNYHQFSEITKNHKHRDFYATVEKVTEICKLFNGDLLKELPLIAPTFKKKLTEPQIVALEEKTIYLNPNVYSFPKEVVDNIHTSIIVELLGYVLHTTHENKITFPQWISNLIQRLDNKDFVFSSVEDIVKTTGYAHGYVCRQFKKHVGKTLSSYSSEIRLRESIELLKTSTILHTASCFGWDNPKNYNEAFKKLFGITPSQYKKSLQNDAND